MRTAMDDHDTRADARDANLAALVQVVGLEGVATADQQFSHLASHRIAREVRLHVRQRQAGELVAE